MALFEAAMSEAFKAEGGYVDDPKDPGGATNLGVSLRWLATLTEIRGGHAEGDINGDGIIDVRDVKSMTRAQAADLYRRHWWDRYRYDQLTQALATRLFCTAINMGAGPANRILQRACRAHLRPLVDDGNMGPITLQGVRDVVMRDGERALLATYREGQANYYRALVASNKGLSKFLNGWLNRAYAE